IGVRTISALSRISSPLLGGKHTLPAPNFGCASAKLFPAFESRVVSSVSVSVVHSLGFDMGLAVMIMPAPLPLYVTVRSFQSNSHARKNLTRLYKPKSAVSFSRSPLNAAGLCDASHELALVSILIRHPAMDGEGGELYAH